jgi:hypothetical protein
MFAARTRLLALAVLTLAVGPLGAAPSPSGRAGPSCWSVSWGVIDGSGRRAFLANATGGIDALDLATGKVLWSTPEVSRPLAVFAGLLLASVPDRDDTLRVLVLNWAGKCLLRSDPVIPPELGPPAAGRGGPRGGRGGRGGGGGPPGGGGLPGGPGGSRGRRPRAFPPTALVRDGELHLFWMPRFRGRGGPWAGADGAPPRRRGPTVAGAVAVDLKTGKIRSLEVDKVPAPDTPPLPARAEKGITQLLEDETVELKRLLVTPRCAAVVAATALPDESYRVELRRWDARTGKALPRLKLLEGEEVRLVASLDGLSFLVGRAPRPDEPRTGRVWSAYATATGKKLATFASLSGTTLLTVLGRRAFLVEREGRPSADGPPPSATLRAVDLRTGKVLWERPMPIRFRPPRFMR